MRERDNALARVGSRIATTVTLIDMPLYYVAQVGDLAQRARAQLRLATTARRFTRPF
jgi:hypothetical protein